MDVTGGRVRPDASEVLDWLSEVADPEIPVLNIVEMGIVRGVEIGCGVEKGREMAVGRGLAVGHDLADGSGAKIADEGRMITVRITPTYSGCPAMNVIEADIRRKLEEKGAPEARVVTDWTEVWTTDWFTEEALAKLKAYGIAPPPRLDASAQSLAAFKSTRKIVPCPLCDALDTRLVSEFGSTACKSQYACDACRNPFEHFKCI